MKNLSDKNFSALCIFGICEIWTSISKKLTKTLKILVHYFNETYKIYWYPIFTLGMLMEVSIYHLQVYMSKENVLVYHITSCSLIHKGAWGYQCVYIKLFLYHLQVYLSRNKIHWYPLHVNGSYYLPSASISILGDCTCWSYNKLQSYT